jgi:hypothetical protein
MRKVDLFNPAPERFRCGIGFFGFGIEHDNGKLLSANPAYYVGFPEDGFQKVRYRLNHFIPATMSIFVVNPLKISMSNIIKENSRIAPGSLDRLVAPVQKVPALFSPLSSSNAHFLKLAVNQLPISNILQGEQTPIISFLLRISLGVPKESFFSLPP